MFICKAKIGIVTSIFNKISKLTSFQVKEAHIGKIMNLVSNDLNTADMKMIILLYYTF